MRVIGFFFFFFCIGILYASNTDLYQIKERVSDQSHSTRQEALSEALAKVLVRVTGQEDIRALPIIQKVLFTTEKYIKKYSYVTEDVDGLVQLYLSVDFIKTEIDQFLRKNNISVWGQYRPRTIAWMVVKRNNVREILNQYSDEELVEDLNHSFQKVAMPISFPVMDIEERISVDISDIWGLFKDKVLNVSERYGVNSIIAGRLVVVEKGRKEVFSGMIKFFLLDKVYSLKVEEMSSDALSHAVVRIISSVFSKQYTIDPTSKQETIMRIENIYNTESYSGVMNYLKNMTAIQSVTSKIATKNWLEVKLEMNGNLDQFIEMIHRDRHLETVKSNSFNDTRNKINGLDFASSILHYRWKTK